MKTFQVACLLLISFSAIAQNEFPCEAVLTDMDGKEVNSSTFSNDGKPMIIDFWGAFCKPCIVKYNAMMEVYEKWQTDTGVKIIIVSIDHERMQATTKKIMAKFDWPFEAYFDGDQELMDQLADGGSVPRTFIFDGNHKLVYKKTGARILPKDKKVPTDSVMYMMYEGGSISALTCDLSGYEKVIYDLAKD